LLGAAECVVSSCMFVNVCNNVYTGVLSGGTGTVLNVRRGMITASTELYACKSPPLTVAQGTVMHMIKPHLLGLFLDV
jgi:hypothetical protein